MTRAIDATPIGVFGFAVVLMLASLTISAGLIPNDTMSLWAGAIIAGDGKISLGRIVAAYPTLPFLATATLELVTPRGAPTPALLAAALLGLLAGIWFVAFRRRGLPLIAAGAATGLLALHPALLRAAMAGPSEMLVAVFLYLVRQRAVRSARARRGAGSHDGRAFAAWPRLLASYGRRHRLRRRALSGVRGEPDAGRQFRV